MCPAFLRGLNMDRWPGWVPRIEALSNRRGQSPRTYSGFSRSVGSTDFAITFPRSRKLSTPPPRDTSCRRCCTSVGVPSIHDGPGHAGRLVGHGDRRDEARFAAEQRNQPGVGLGRYRPSKQHCVCATDQQTSEIAVAPFADPTQPCLAAGGVLSRHEPEPGSKLTTTVEHAWVWNRRRNRGCDDRPDPRYGGQALTDRVALVPCQDLRLERSDPPLDLADLAGNHLQHLTSHSRYALIRVILHDRSKSCHPMQA